MNTFILKHVLKDAGKVRGEKTEDEHVYTETCLTLKDAGKEWSVGLVTSVNPLRVTVGEDDPNATGYAWEEVRPLDETRRALLAERAQVRRNIVYIKC